MVRSTISVSQALTSATGSIGIGRLAITKKLVLWSVLILQIGFIGCIWLLQMNYSSQDQQQGLDLSHNRVNFVKSGRGGGETAAGRGQSHSLGTHCPRQHENVNRYDRDFYQMKPDRLNDTQIQTDDYNVPAYVAMEMETATALWCYREGTVNESSQHINDVDYLMAPPQCRCASGWHGRDCGQPEIIWRALMTHSRASKRGGGTAPLQLTEASSSSLHRLFYMVELGAWEHISLELLELQLRALLEVVDYFLIYYVSNSTKERILDSLLGGKASYVLYRCTSAGNCSSAVAYAHFRRQLWSLCGVQMEAKDLLLHGDSRTVYAPAALKFLKYYAKDVLPLRFRLKYNVYGFYWQHPKRTLLNGVISSLGHLRGAQLDPHLLQRQASNPLGDLNHYGGWSCELCLPPEQIVLLLQQQSSSHKLPVKLPNDTRNAHIDATYMQKLMANGYHIDGATKLLRLRQQNEKYYAPDEALLHSSQFGQLLVNLYDVDVFEDLQEDTD